MAEIRIRWRKVVLPMRRIWKRVVVRLGFRNRGLLKLQNDVKSCEYEDIHVMWQILHKNEELARSSPGIKKKDCWKLFMCRGAPYFCRSF